MTKPNTVFSVPFSVVALKRALRTARKLGLEINSYEIAPDGGICVHTGPRSVERESVGDKLENLGLPTGEAA
jgi:hypothetical protein